MKKLKEKVLNKLDFTKKTIVLTGYSKGIGLETANHLVSLGAKLILIGRKNTNITNSHLYKCDLSNSVKLEKILSKIKKKYKKIDGVVHCAGVNFIRKIDKISLQEWNNVYSVNLTSSFLIIKHLKNNLKKSKEASIVLVSSIAGHRKSVVSGAHYVSSKAALIGLVRQLSQDLGREKIRINALSPSQTFTQMLKNSMNQKQINSLSKQIPLNRLANTEEQSYNIIFLLSSLSSYINGISLNSDGGQI